MKENCERETLFVLISVSCLLIFSLICLIPSSAEASDGHFGGGNGTASSPYIIEDVYDLQNMSAHLSANYILANDIDAYITTGWNDGAGFIPIGTYESQFRGSLDGNGFNITGLYINNSDLPYSGLFGYVKSGTVIRDVTLHDVNVTDLFYNRNGIAGALVGVNNGVVTECSAGGYVYGRGGLVGYNAGSITGSHSSVNVSGYYQTGGLVGISLGSIVNSYSTGDVLSENKWGGGLVGDNYAKIENCYATGDVHGHIYVGGLVGQNTDQIHNSYATGDVHGDYYVGGLVGNNTRENIITPFIQASEGRVRYCSATGDVYGLAFVGGLVGVNERNIINSYAHGNVSGDSSIGGLVGSNIKNIQESYSIGTVIGNSSHGGLTGDNSGSIVNSFWDNESSGISESSFGTGRNTFDMMSKSTFKGAGWDFVSVWWIVDGETYPHLHHETPPVVIAVAGYDVETSVNTTVAFNASYSLGNYSNCTWTFIYGNETIILVGASQYFDFNLSGVYVVTLTITGEDETIYASNLTVTVNDVVDDSIPPEVKDHTYMIVAALVVLVLGVLIFLWKRP